MIVKLRVRVRDKEENLNRFSDIKINPYIIENDEVIKSDISYSIRKVTKTIIGNSLDKIYTQDNIAKKGEEPIIAMETELITKNINLIIEKFNESFKDKYHIEEVKDNLDEGFKNAFTVVTSNENLYDDLKVIKYKENLTILMKTGVFIHLSASMMYELVKEIDKL